MVDRSLVGVLYGVSPIGLGHASRAAAVGSVLAQRGVEVTFATGGPAVPFLKSYGFNVVEAIAEPNPHVFGGKVVLSSLWYIRYWVGYRASKKRMAALADQLRPDLIVGDEEFSGLSLASERGWKCAMIADELDLAFARTYVTRRIESSVRSWYSSLQAKVSLLIVPDCGRDTGNVRYVGPVVRPVTRSREEALKGVGLPPEKRLILVSLSGSGIGSYLAERAVKAIRDMKRENCVTAVVGGDGPRHNEDMVHYLGFVRDQQDLIGASDLVIALAGKSTIDEASSSGTPIIAIPIRNHFEQEKNAARLGYSYSDIDRLAELIPSNLGRRLDPKNYDGAARAADELVALIGSPEP